MLKKIIAYSTALGLLVFSFNTANAANLVGTPLDPYEPDIEQCGITPTVDQANQQKIGLRGQVAPIVGNMFSKLAYSYLKGCGKIKQDFEEAQYWMEFAVEQKDPIATINLAWMLQNNIGFDQDKEKAQSLYQSIINGDYQPRIKKKAISALAMLNGNYASDSNNEKKKTVVVNGLVGVPANPFEPDTKSCGLTPTVDQANQQKIGLKNTIYPSVAPMFSKLAYSYLKGCGKIKQDFEEAKYWMEYAARQKDSIAIFNLGWMYQNGIGYEKNLIKAKEFYDLAAQSSPNLANLASTNFGGTTVTKGDSEKIDVTAGSTQIKSATSSKSSSPLKVTVKPSAIDQDGKLTIDVQSSNKLVSLKINGRDEGESPAGNRIIPRAVSVGTRKFKIELLDECGQTSQQEISVTREITVVAETLPSLNPSAIKVSKPRDAIALIIGIENYKNAPKAEFAESDASLFYDYARKALGVPENRIKLLQGTNAGKLDILKQLKTWMAAQVNAGTTDIYVFYSGHGLASADGKTSYILPYDADTALLDESSIRLNDFITSLEGNKPKSVTLFMDSCYSGQGKNGTTLLASARPLSINATKPLLSANVTILTSAAGDQIAISAPEIKHGLFSYFLMRGMEGAADTNRDGNISMQELHQYVSLNVAREATLRGKQQSPTLQGSGEIILVGK